MDDRTRFVQHNSSSLVLVNVGDNCRFHFSMNDGTSSVHIRNQTGSQTYDYGNGNHRIEVQGRTIYASSYDTIRLSEGEDFETSEDSEDSEDTKDSEDSEDSKDSVDSEDSIDSEDSPKMKTPAVLHKRDRVRNSASSFPDENQLHRAPGSAPERKPPPGLPAAVPGAQGVLSEQPANGATSRSAAQPPTETAKDDNRAAATCAVGMARKPGPGPLDTAPSARGVLTEQSANGATSGNAVKTAEEDSRARAVAAATCALDAARARLEAAEDDEEWLHGVADRALGSHVAMVPVQAHGDAVQRLLAAQAEYRAVRDRRWNLLLGIPESSCSSNTSMASASASPQSFFNGSAARGGDRNDVADAGLSPDTATSGRPSARPGAVDHDHVGAILFSPIPSSPPLNPPAQFASAPPETIPPRAPQSPPPAALNSGAVPVKRPSSVVVTPPHERTPGTLRRAPETINLPAGYATPTTDLPAGTGPLTSDPPAAFGPPTTNQPAESFSPTAAVPCGAPATYRLLSARMSRWGNLAWEIEFPSKKGARAPWTNRRTAGGLGRGASRAGDPLVESAPQSTAVPTASSPPTTAVPFDAPVNVRMSRSGHLAWEIKIPLMQNDRAPKSDATQTAGRKAGGLNGGVALSTAAGSAPGEAQPGSHTGDQAMDEDSEEAGHDMRGSSVNGTGESISEALEEAPEEGAVEGEGTDADMERDDFVRVGDAEKGEGTEKTILVDPEGVHAPPKPAARGADVIIEPDAGASAPTVVPPPASIPYEKLMRRVKNLLEEFDEPKAQFEALMALKWETDKVYSGNEYENSMTLDQGARDLISALPPRSGSVSGSDPASLHDSETILKEWGRNLQLACTSIDQMAAVEAEPVEAAFPASQNASRTVDIKECKDHAEAPNEQVPADEPVIGAAQLLALRSQAAAFGDQKPADGVAREKCSPVAAAGGAVMNLSEAKGGPTRQRRRSRAMGSLARHKR